MQAERRDGLHVAIIMDGNGRWATRRGLPRVAGHRAGVEAVRHIVEHAPDAGVCRLTLYAFSSDNWNRPATEVESIFWLMRAYLRLETKKLKQQGVKLQVIGRRDRLPKTLLRAIEQAEFATCDGQRLHLRVALDYSSRDAITRAFSNVANATTLNAAQAPDLLRNAVAEALTADSGNVDLLIRTGGEKRLSDFLLWESAYAELLFTDRMWPDFSSTDLDAALQEFHRRQRRFGGLPASASSALSATGGGGRPSL
jgi:undecaprenyl diphosphate synthase